MSDDHQRSPTHRRHLMFAGFHHRAAAVHREHIIRAAHQHGGLTAAEIAQCSGMDIEVVEKLLARPGHHPVRHLRALRMLWGVDDDPATSAAADTVLAHAVEAADLHAALARDQP